jgi:hypothetical protein
MPRSQRLKTGLPAHVQTFLACPSGLVNIDIDVVRICRLIADIHLF